MIDRFDTFVCIDWSGERTARPKGLAVAYCKTGSGAPSLLRPSGGWSRQTLLEWLTAHGAAGSNALIGLDLSPAFPAPYFPQHEGPADAPSLWQAVDEICSGDDHLAATSFVTHPDFGRYFRHQTGEGDLFGGGAGRFRQVEMRQRGSGVSPVSCFNLVGAAQVGKSSLTGMRVLNRLRGKVAVWPFDEVPAVGPVIVEIYTSIAARAAKLPRRITKIRDAVTLDAALGELGSEPHAPLARYDDHSTDALITAAWLRHVGSDASLWTPPGLDAVRRTEGWTFGVP